MSIISDRTTIYNRDGRSETLPAEQARYRVYMSPGDWGFAPPPPPGWEFEIPRYRVTRDLQPAQKARFRFEPPFSETWQSDVWQYGEKPLARGDEITTTAWPHPSMSPLTLPTARSWSTAPRSAPARRRPPSRHGDTIYERPRASGHGEF